MSQANQHVGKASRSEAQVLLVEDHPLTRLGMSELIASQSDMTVAYEASGVSEALKKVNESPPDVAVVDISLQDGNGMELVKQLVALQKDIKVLVVSMHDENLFAERALKAGAMGYINKHEATTAVADAIRQIMRGKLYLSGNVAERVLHRAVRGGEEESSSSPLEGLSDRELEVFELIGRGLTTRQIADQLHLSPKTVDTHREHIKSKLGLESPNDLIRHAVQWVMEQA